jgi:hypothetical protein
MVISLVKCNNVDKKPKKNHPMGSSISEESTSIYQNLLNSCSQLLGGDFLLSSPTMGMKTKKQLSCDSFILLLFFQILYGQIII